MRAAPTSRMTAGVVALALLWVAALAPVYGQTQLQPLPPLLRQVSDAVGVMSVEEGLALSHLLSDIEDKTRTKIIVVVLPTVVPESIDGYATRLSRRWLESGKIADDERFVFIVIAKDDRLLRVVPSRRLARIIKPFERSHTMREVPALLRQGKYYDALTAIAQKLSELVAQHTA